MYSTHQSCLICGSRKLIELPRYQHAFLVRCRDCKFVFTRRIPESEELIHHYNKYVRGVKISPITIQRYHKLLDQFEKHRTHGKILDIGCGDGHFLEVALQRGWDAYGTEFTNEAIACCTEKGIKVVKGILEPANYTSGSFDVITSFEVIEHINNPVEEIKNVNVLLRDKGIFYFTTPNFNSLTRYMIGPQWNVIEYPEHLAYYTSHSANLLLRQEGLRKLKLISSGFSINRFSFNTKKNAGNSGPRPNSDELLRTEIEGRYILKVAKNIVNAFLAFFRIGDTLKGCYLKK